MNHMLLLTGERAVHVRMTRGSVGEITLHVCDLDLDKESVLAPVVIVCVFMAFILLACK